MGPLITLTRRLCGFYGSWGPGHSSEHHSEFIDSCHCPRSKSGINSLCYRIRKMQPALLATPAGVGGSHVHGEAGLEPTGFLSSADVQPAGGLACLLSLLGKNQTVTAPSDEMQEPRSPPCPSGLPSVYLAWED